MTVWETINSLKFGDLIEIGWYDAAEDEAYDTPIRSYGVFLGVKGLRAKHVVIAKEIAELDKECHYNIIRSGRYAEF